MGLFGGISHALSSVANSVTDVGNNLGLGPTGALVNGVVNIKDPIDSAWKTITPWNENSEGALGIGKITPWKESGDLVSPSTFADVALLLGGAYAAGGLGASSGSGGLFSGGVTSGGLAGDAAISTTPTLSESLAANSMFSPSSTAGAGVLSGAGTGSGAGSSAGLFSGLTGFQKAALGIGAANTAIQGVGGYMQAQQANELAKQQAAWNAQQQENYDKTNYMGYTPKYDYTGIAQRGNSDPVYRAGAISALNRIKAMRGA
jgi:hypothetical protein